MKNKVLYVVEEVEGKDGSVSEEFSSMDRAKKRFDKLRSEKQQKSTTGIRLWVCIVTDEVEF